MPGAIRSNSPSSSLAAFGWRRRNSCSNSWYMSNREAAAERLTLSMTTPCLTDAPPTDLSPRPVRTVMPLSSAQSISDSISSSSMLSRSTRSISLPVSPRHPSKAASTSSCVSSIGPPASSSRATSASSLACSFARNPSISSRASSSVAGLPSVVNAA